MEPEDIKTYYKELVEQKQRMKTALRTIEASMEGAEKYLNISSREATQLQEEILRKMDHEPELLPPASPAASLIRRDNKSEGLYTGNSIILL
jgi:tRNA A37 methylthiotransferase MiaB